MSVKKKSSKFEAQVHLGILIIIFVLIALNFSSNYIIHNARLTERQATLAHLQRVAISISMTLFELAPSPSPEKVEEFKQDFDLSGLMVIPSQPENPSRQARLAWFSDFVYRLPPGQVPEVARKILGAEYLKLTRGERDEYFFVHPVLSAKGKYLLILSVTSPELAYLDDSSERVLVVTIISTFLIIITYLILSRYIFLPLRRLHQQAVEAGRVLVGHDDEAEGVVEDYRKVIDELKEKEQRLLWLNERIQLRADTLEQFNDYLLQSTSSGVVTCDREGHLLSINEACSRMFKIKPQDYIGDHFSKFFGEGSVISNTLGGVIHKGDNQPYLETEVKLADGTQVNMGFSISIVVDSDQQPIGASIIISEVNEVINLRKELEAKNRLAALGEMSGGLAHQLRNSMGTIVGYCNLIRKQLSSKPQDNEHLADLLSEAKETEALVKRFLNFAGPLEFQPDSVLLNELLSEIVDSFKSRAKANHIAIAYNPIPIDKEHQDAELKLHVDALLIKQALNNLIDNAISACEGRSGKIEITAMQDGQQLIISVADNGKGIPEDELEKIFTPFFSSKPSGTGLGLPLAAKIIDLHSGNIQVRSAAGEGTTFLVHLPLDAISDIHKIAR